MSSTKGHAYVHIVKENVLGVSVYREIIIHSYTVHLPMSSKLSSAFDS